MDSLAMSTDDLMKTGQIESVASSTERGLTPDLLEAVMVAVARFIPTKPLSRL